MTLWDKEKYKPDAWIEMRTDELPEKKGRKPGKNLGIWMQMSIDNQCKLRRHKIQKQCSTWEAFVEYILELLEEQK